jgi:hypothetical protein
VKQPTTAAFFELAFPLFLLFLQEIISDRDPPPPQKSWDSGGQLGTEQRAGPF